ncbi:uncharacterized protein LTR77_005535 [Saxophila tyrrhenica]|uniref:Mitochondrial genome maintenance protein MGM101 n=1 Tax=Saxophila tyrrhenica TaxID=1690608 RepID=A0AAV9P8S9_9PEZI|nr:hypothetical protein LTR77_005535 [Saxophila tyrrhenica]
MAAPRRIGARLVASLNQQPSRCANPKQRFHVPTIRPLSTLPKRSQQAQPTTSTSNPPQPAHTPKPSPTEATANAAAVHNNLTPTSDSDPLRSLDNPSPILEPDSTQTDWTRSFSGLSSTPFTPEQASILMESIPFDDIEIKPDGIIYLPEIKYRRILNRAFGPGGWGLAPRGETIVTGKQVTREYGLVCMGRLVSVARGEQVYFDPEGVPMATEGCKSNALMRCCKDLGVASELWDPRFIKRFMAEMGREIVVEHQTTRKRRRHFMRKDDEVKFPFKEVQGGVGGGQQGGGGGAYRKTGS